jgi:hypothetical protein
MAQEGPDYDAIFRAGRLQASVYPDLIKRFLAFYQTEESNPDLYAHYMNELKLAEGKRKREEAERKAAEKAASKTPVEDVEESDPLTPPVRKRGRPKSSPKKT